MKQSVTITAAHLDVSYTTDQLMGRAELSLEIDGKWVKVITERFDPAGFHVSHIVEGLGIIAALRQSRQEDKHG